MNRKSERKRERELRRSGLILVRIKRAYHAGDERDARLDRVREAGITDGDRYTDDSPETLALIDDLGPMNLAEVGMHLGISRERVRQIEVQGLQRLDPSTPRGRYTVSLLERRIAHLYSLARRGEATAEDYIALDEACDALDFLDSRQAIVDELRRRSDAMPHLWDAIELEAPQTGVGRSL